MAGVTAGGSEEPSSMELYPTLMIVLGVVGGTLVVLIVIIVMMVVRQPWRETTQGRLNHDDSHIHKKDDKSRDCVDVDEKDPDVIPDTRGGCVDSMDRRGVANVSMIYGEIVGHSSPETSHDPAETPHILTGSCVDSNHVTHATHAHAKQAHIHVKPKPSTQQSQYIQREYSSPVPVELQHSTTFHHMLSTATSIPEPMYTHAHAMPISHTQTMPHPRTSRARSHNHSTTLKRRSSLYMDPMSISLAPPIAPPPAYDTPTPSLTPDVMTVVAMVAETVSITPHTSLHSYTCPPDLYQPKPFPTTFSSDRLESAV
nr:uncharacterized protein LOC128690169 [Cherax quadricarinatus]